jgi:hypothetical protein
MNNTVNDGNDLFRRQEPLPREQMPMRDDQAPKHIHAGIGDHLCYRADFSIRSANGHAIFDQQITALLHILSLLSDADQGRDVPARRRAMTSAAKGSAASSKIGEAGSGTSGVRCGISGGVPPPPPP